MIRDRRSFKVDAEIHEQQGKDRRTFHKAPKSAIFRLCGCSESFLESRQKSCYNEPMSGIAIKDDIMPSATPSDDEIRRWQALPRDEQTKRLRKTLDEADASGMSNRTMDDIEAAAQRRLATMRHG